MVPAQAVLEKAIDTKKVQSGEQFRATLSSTVYLKDGVELPRNAVLVGTIAAGKMQAGGKSTLALRFTKAELNDGKAVPIQADIMGISPPSYGSNSVYSDSDPEASPLPWNGKILRVDEPGALSGVEFHSSIASENSGVFVSAKKHNMKVPSGSQFSLAIAAKRANGTSGGA